MMNKAIVILLILATCGCTDHSMEVKTLQARVDSLEHRLNESYRPGLGEIMRGIQIHHNKLWFAGQNQNWKLAQFEVHEIDESMEKIQKFHAQREEIKTIAMIEPALDSVDSAIEKGDPAAFLNSYTFLTNTCNNCHKSSGHEFIVVKVPEQPAFGNQEYRVTGHDWKFRPVRNGKEISD